MANQTKFDFKKQVRAGYGDNQHQHHFEKVWRWNGVPQASPGVNPKYRASNKP